MSSKIILNGSLSDIALVFKKQTIIFIFFFSFNSFGFCEKVSVGGHKPIGQYGNGFKSGSMRLGRDALVFTRTNNTMSVGMLSQNYLEAVKEETVLVPIVTWKLPQSILWNIALPFLFLSVIISN